MAESNSTERDGIQDFNSGDLKNAQTQASRAMTKLSPGSPGYLKAEDILNFRPSGTAEN